MAPFGLLWRVPDALTPPHIMTRDGLPIASSLNGLVTLCAEPCLANYVNSFWVPQPCTNTSGISCLCDNYSTSGYALGEIALECVAKACSQASQSQSSQAINICASQTGAVPATHTSLQVNISVVLTSTTSAIPSVSRLSLTLPPLVPTVGTATATATSGPASTLAISTSTIPTATSASNTTAPHSGSLTTGQSIGITLGAFGGFGVALFLIFCCCWRRKKITDKKSKDEKAKNHHSYDFRCATTPTSPRQAATRDAIPDSQPRRLNLFNTRSRQLSADDKIHIYNLRVHRGRVIDKYSGPSATKAQLVAPTPSTTRSVDKYYGAQPIPIISKQKSPRGRWSRPLSTTSHLTTFEEDQVPAVPEVVAIPAPLKSRKPGSSTSSKGRRGSIKRLKLKLNIPPTQILQQKGGVEMETTRGLKSATLHPISSRRQRSASQFSALLPSAVSGISYVPSYYMSNDSRTPPMPPKSPARKDYARERGRPDSRAWPLSKKTDRSRISMSSDTTFESVGPDEVTPPEEEEKQLEGKVSSPGSNVRYPRVPRSAAQAVPRSPVLKDPPKTLRDPPGRQEWARRRQEARGPQGQQNVNSTEEPVYWF